MWDIGNRCSRLAPAVGPSPARVAGFAAIEDGPAAGMPYGSDAAGPMMRVSLFIWVILANGIALSSGFRPCLARNGARPGLVNEPRCNAKLAAVNK